MVELDAQQVTITDPFWRPRQEMNARQALLHQWEQLEKSGSIENFRLLAEGKEGLREGWFFAGSDVHKWLDAASRAYAAYPSAEDIKLAYDPALSYIIVSLAESHPSVHSFIIKKDKVFQERIEIVGEKK